MSGNAIIFLTNRCNQDCLFCSNSKRDKAQTPAEIRRIILSHSNTISLEGGEPTLVKALVDYVRLAKKHGTKDIILCTNGAALSNERYVRDMLEAGLHLFNVNFPSHIEKLFDALTRTKGHFRQRVETIRRLIVLAGPGKVRLTLVINSLNYRTLRGYVEFIKANFPGLFYVELNLVKVLGYVKHRRYLVPRLGDVEPHLRSAMGYCRRQGLNFISDGFPLCVLEGFEDHAIDAFKLLHKDNSYLNEKARTPVCRGCSLIPVCAGPRRDYVRLYGDGELRPSRKDPAPIIATLTGAGESSAPRARGGGGRR